MTEKGIDIFHELQKLQFTNISKIGKEQQKVLGKRTIQGFLEQRALREELSKKIALSLVSSKSANNIEEELNGISKENEVVFNDVQHSHKHNITNNEHYSEQPKKEFTKYIRLLQKQHKEIIRDNNNKHNNKYNNRNTKPFHKKNYPVNYELIKQLKKQRHKVPESCAYHPNYNAISPHVPYVKLQPLKEKNSKLTSSSMDESNVVQSQASIVDVVDGSSYKRNNVIPFEKYSPRSDIVRKDVNKDRIVLEPIKVKKKVSVPNFKKMLSRNKSVFNVLGRVESIMDYTPNYKAVHYNSMGYNKGDINLYNKKVLVKRIWTSFDASAEYVVVPKLNEIQ